jgi:hypothetical protein
MLGSACMKGPIVAVDQVPVHAAHSGVKLHGGVSFQGVIVARPLVKLPGVRCVIEPCLI